jgi:raffinose/stachyose/melibiose transport system substrate-binding protein
MKKSYIVFLVLLLMGILSMPLFAAGEQEAPGEQTGEEEGKVEILWWSHWANEPAKVEVIERIKDDYMAAHPNVEIELVWWDKQPLQEAWRTAMTAGQGAPDIVTDPAGNTIPQLEAGWFIPLGDKFPWENYKPGAKENAKYLGFDGYYKYNIGQSINMIFYNKDIFEELGIQIPDDYTFTAEQWLDISKKADAKGYAGSALAIGNRPYPALFPLFFSLFSRVGTEEAYKYINGQKSWDTPQAREVLDWFAQLDEVGFWPETFSTMSIDEFHIYFHTQHKAATLWIPSWYTGRAFKSEAEGGQSPDFHFGMLRYPKFDNGKAHDKVIGSYESGYMISSATEHPEVARDILSFAAQPKYGAAWELITDIPSAIAYEESDVPTNIPESKWSWYHREIGKVYGPLEMKTLELLAPPERTGDFANATQSVLNEGIPLGLITVDEAIKKLDQAMK